jgi:predicted Zn-dependent peptidase
VPRTTDSLQAGGNPACYYLNNMEKLSVRKFENGLTLIELPNNALKTCAIGFYFGTGSRYETPRLRGISHFCEHILGIKILKFEKISTHPIWRTHDALTTKETIQFDFETDPENAGAVINLFLSLLVKPEIELENIKIEKKVIASEIKRGASSGIAKLLTDTFNNSYFANNTLSNRITGTVASVNALPPKKILQLFRSVFSPGHATIVIAGSYSKSEVRKIIKVHSANWRKVPYPAIGSLKAFSRKENLVKIVQSERGNDTVEAVSAIKISTYEEELALRVYLAALENAMFSIRENGLSYDPEAYVENYSEFANVGVYASFRPNQTNKGVMKMLEILGAPEQWLDKKLISKYTSKISYDRKLETEYPLDQVRSVGSQALRFPGQKPFHPTEETEFFKKISFSQILALSKRISRLPRFWLLSASSVKRLREVRKIIKDFNIDQ